MSGPLLQTALVRNGRFTFSGVGEGNYTLLLEAEDHERVEKDFILQNLTPGQIEFIHVNLGAPLKTGQESSSPPGTVDAKSLSLPPAAAKELEKASKAGRKKQFEKAVEHIQTALRIYPDYYPSYNNLGVQYLHLERWAEAREAFQKSLDLHPTAMASMNLGILLMRQEQIAKALTLLQNAVELDPSDDLAARSLGEAYFRNGDHEAALQLFEDLGRRDPDPTLNIAKANCYLRLDRPEDARREYRQFLEKEARGPRAEFIRAQLLSITP